MIIDSLNINLIQEFGLEDFPDEEKQKLQDQLNELFVRRLNIAVLARLSEEQKTELDTVLEDPSGDIFSFYEKSIPGFKVLALEVLADIKKETVELMGAVKELQSKSE